MHIVYFVEGATDPIDDFGARGVRYVPLAGGSDECEPRVSSLHLARGSRLPEAPCVNDSALLVVYGRLNVCGDWEIELSGGMGVVLSAGEPVRLESDEGAIVIAVEAPRLIATLRDCSTPGRTMGQRWPGERLPRRTLGSMIRSIYYRIRWWRLELSRLRKFLARKSRHARHGPG
jgi:hypothetical protein